MTKEIKSVTWLSSQPEYKNMLVSEFVKLPDVQAAFAFLESENEKPKIKYLVVNEDNIHELSEEVCRLMTDGYKCQGGIHVSTTPVNDRHGNFDYYHSYYYQAMVLRDSAE